MKLTVDEFLEQVQYSIGCVVTYYYARDPLECYVYIYVGVVHSHCSLS